MDGHGTTVTFGTSGFTADLISVDGPDIKRESIDNTFMDSITAMEFEPAGLYDGGEVTLTIAHAVASLPPISGDAETITINWAGSGDSYTFSAFVTGYKGGAKIGERMEGELKLKVTGTISA